MIRFVADSCRDRFKVLYVGTGDSPATVPFYEKCGFCRSHVVRNFFTEHYDHPIFECGRRLVDMVYLKMELREKEPSGKNQDKRSMCDGLHQQIDVLCPL